MTSATTETSACWNQALKSLAKLPPFSPILHRLLGEMAREAVSFGKLAELIEKDTVLAANVLRVVNSALYSRGATVSSVRHAVSLLGLHKLRNIVLSLSVSAMWNHTRTSSHWSMPHFNRHSVATGMLADAVAVEVSLDCAESAFAAGLLHDIGKLLIAVAFPEQFEEIDRLAGPEWANECSCEQSVLGFTHAELSEAVLVRWNLPAPIVEAVRNHHQPHPRYSRSLSAVIASADRCANELGHGSRPAAARQGDPLDFLDALGLGGSAAAIIDSFQCDFEAIREFF